MDLTGWLWLIVGVVACAVAAWSWLGRSPHARWWFRRSRYYPLVLGALPGMGLLLVVGGLYHLAGDSSEPYLVPFFLLGAAITFIGVFHPRWWGPGWFRRAPENRHQVRKTG